MSFTGSIFCLFIVVFFSEANIVKQAPSDDQNNPDRQDLFGEHDFFEIYFVKSYPKSMTTAYENSFTVQTSGLLIRNIKTLDVLTLEYLPANWDNCFFPTIQILENQSAGHVTWNKTGQLVKSHHLHAADFAEALFLGTMNGVVRASFLDWVTKEYVDKPQTFSPQSVCVYKTVTLTPVNESCPVSLNNWDTFVIQSLDVLAKYDVKISSILPVSGNRITIQCSSVSDRLLYHTKLPSYYKSFYSCMEGEWGVCVVCFDSHANCFHVVSCFLPLFVVNIQIFTL